MTVNDEKWKQTEWLDRWLESTCWDKMSVRFSKWATRYKTFSWIWKLLSNNKWKFFLSKAWIFDPQPVKNKVKCEEHKLIFLKLKYENSKVHRTFSSFPYDCIFFYKLREFFPTFYFSLLSLNHHENHRLREKFSCLLLSVEAQLVIKIAMNFPEQVCSRVAFGWIKSIFSRSRRWLT